MSATSNFTFQNLHGCTINITQATPTQVQHKDNAVTDLMSIDIDKLIASIEENY